MSLNKNYSAGKVKVPFQDDLDTAGGILAIANPEGVELIVDLVALKIETASTGACTVDVGIAANATTSSDNLMDAADVNTATTKTLGVNPGTNGKRDVVWGPNQFLTISRASGAAAGLVGSLILKYTRTD